jgi:probable HAF family extracellular repeat protein
MGQIAGAAGSTNPPDADHAFLYSEGVMQDLGTFGALGSLGEAINESRQVVGYSFLGGSANYHAFWYDGATMNDLGTLSGDDSGAYGINDSGQIVGFADTDSGYDAFLYMDGEMYNLNSLLLLPNTWTLQFASAINNNGQIVGYGINPAGYQHGFLLVPQGPFSPFIVIQPTNQYLSVGANASFSFIASGGSDSYQWYGPSGMISGATNSTLLLSDAQLENAGGYTAMVSNPYGVVSSLPGNLIFLVPTTRQPAASEIGIGTIPPAGLDQLEVFTNGSFEAVSSEVRPNPNSLTIVMTPGWMDSPTSWPTEMAAAIETNVTGILINLLAWNWSGAASSPDFELAGGVSSRTRSCFRTKPRTMAWLRILAAPALHWA